jgi:hypothetical protein
MTETYYVYVISRDSEKGMTAPVKIGISKTPNARLDTIQTSCPFPIKLAYVFGCPNREIAQVIERSFHETQRKNKEHGEWFSYEPLEAIHTLCVAFRVALQHHIDDQELIDDALDWCGVLAIEKQFNLAIPTQGRVQ